MVNRDPKNNNQPYDPKNLVNNSVNNTGINKLPKPRVPFHYYKRSCSIIGGVYHKTDDKDAFPEHYDNCLIFADWNESWFKAIRMDKKENIG